MVLRTLVVASSAVVTRWGCTSLSRTCRRREPSTQTLRHMTMRPTSSRVLAAMLVLVFLAGCTDGGGSSDSCEPGTTPCDDTNELQTFFPEVAPES